MAFSPDAAAQLLQHVDGSHQGITATSAKLVFWKRHAPEVVKLWEQAFMQADTEKRLVLLYLMNDVVQTSKRHGMHYVQEFHQVVPGAFKRLLNTANEPIKRSMCKLVKVWRDREVWGHKAQKMYNDMIRDISDSEPAQRPVKQEAAVPEPFSGLVKLIDASHSAALEVAKCRRADTEAQNALAKALPAGTVPDQSHSEAIEAAVKANAALQAAAQQLGFRESAVLAELQKQVTIYNGRVQEAATIRTEAQNREAHVLSLQHILQGGSPENLTSAMNLASANMPSTMPDLMGGGRSHSAGPPTATPMPAAHTNSVAMSMPAPAPVAAGYGPLAGARRDPRAAARASSAAPPPAAPSAPPAPEQQQMPPPVTPQGDGEVSMEDLPEDIPTDLLLEALEQRTHMDPDKTAELFNNVLSSSSDAEQAALIQTFKGAIDS